MKKIINLGFLMFILLQGYAFAQTKKSDTLTRNKELVLDFYQHVFGDKELTNLEDYLTPEYIQHNPNVADGRDAFKKAASGWLSGAPKTKIDVQHIAAEGDLVFLHVKNTLPNGKFQSVIDIFRIENGKIAEHWDVHENVPDKSANAHPMF